jgi:hypothetical protein
LVAPKTWIKEAITSMRVQGTEKLICKLLLRGIFLQEDLFLNN